MSGPLNISPSVGELLVKIIEGDTGVKCHLILIALPIDKEELVNPTVVSSLERDQMENVIIQMAAQMALSTSPIPPREQMQ